MRLPSAVCRGNTDAKGLDALKPPNPQYHPHYAGCNFEGHALQALRRCNSFVNYRAGFDFPGRACNFKLIPEGIRKRLKNKDLQKILMGYPDGMEVLIVYKGSYREVLEDDFSVSKTTVNHCNYSSKWENGIDYYSFLEKNFGYKDQVGGEIVDVELAMQTKDVLVLEC